LQIDGIKSIKQIKTMKRVEGNLINQIKTIKSILIPEWFVKYIKIQILNSAYHFCAYHAVDGTACPAGIFYYCSS